ncbi:MAG: DNA translocase FtsK [bacterium]|nr:DNA translocase FtsK [bacterium]
MAQHPKKKTSSRKPAAKKPAPKAAPAYEADSVMLRTVLGVMLMAVGVMIFLAVDLHMTGAVFSGLRAVCFGLAGLPSLALCVFPIWGGALLVYSSQRKPRVRPFWLCFAIYALVTAAGNLLTYTGTPAMPLLDYFANRYAASPGFDLYLARAWTFSSASVAVGRAGGVLGMLLSWPLWMMLGSVPAAVLCILGAVACFLVLIRFDFRALMSRLESMDEKRRAAAEERDRKLHEEELEWQKKQALDLQLAQQRAVQQAQAAQAAQSAQAAQAAQQWAAQQAGSAPPFGVPGQADSRVRPAPPIKTAEDYGFQPTEEESRTFHQPLQQRGLNVIDRLFGSSTDAPRPRRHAVSIFGKGREEAAGTPDTQPQIAQPAEPQPQTAAEQSAPVTDAPRGTARTSASRPASPLRRAPYHQPAQDPTQVPVVPAGVVQGEVSTAAAAAFRSQIAAHPVSSQPEPDDDDEDSIAMPTPEQLSAPLRSQTSPRQTDVGTFSARPLQQPKPSWSDDTPPWEDSPAAPGFTADDIRIPTVQQTGGDAWKPELNIAPLKEGEASLGDRDRDEAAAMPELPYVYPGLELLSLPKPSNNTSPEEDALRAQRLEETLASFRVDAKVKHVTHGPTISRFELELAPGINVNKVTNLGANIAMNMEVESVRIEAPIPGKKLIGIEVPNRNVETVTLREVLESESMLNNTKPLAVALGKDIAGTPIVCDLAKMPHLLIAGATGSGKSVCINTMINSLLYRCSPKEVRLILIDPKVVELQCYNGIPHLLIPVVSDPHKASGALAWAVGEMTSRYNKFQQRGVRAIDGYNATLEDGEPMMPRIVIIIDELADLMMTCKRDVEEHICRLAQLARAAGIHLVVATQRPSVDVITGLIKANIPSRIAFKVSSFVDSRTILDKIGAEQLLGWGDMLYQPTGKFTPTRIQGCFLSDDEVNRITDFIRDNCPSSYDPDVIEQLDHMETDALGGGKASADSDAAEEDVTGDGSLLQQAIEMTVRDGQVSTSLIQRRLKVGYARAGRLVDEMEKRGIVSQKDGAKPRMCLISMEEYEQMRAADSFGDT